MLPEVRMARVLDAIASHRAGRLSCVEAGELLGFRERHFRRLPDVFKERGEDGLIDRRRWHLSARAADEAEAAWVAEMFRTRYFDDRIKHFHEQIVGLPIASGKPRWLYQRQRERQLDATDRHAICGDDLPWAYHRLVQHPYVPLSEWANA
jgi:hypothetical protein